jgi:signal transduction histidine kinase
VAFRERVDVEVRGDSDVRVSAPRAEALLRIAREAVTNAARHAGVREVDVTLEQRGPRLRLVVKDEGVGFDPSDVSQTAASGCGLGLGSMRARAAAVGGELTVSSGRTGTEVVVIV